MPAADVGLMPGYGTTVDALYRKIWWSQDHKRFIPAGCVIDGSLSRDPLNTSYLDVLQAGMVMGKVTASGKWAPSIIGKNTVAYDGGTSLTVGAATAVEIVRRIGATGSLKLTGPATASGTVRTLTLTYSAVNTTTGVVTVTAANVNEVQRVNFNIASTGGNVILGITDPTTGSVIQATAAWNTTDATYLAAINTALDLATGVAGGIVATAIAATDTDSGFVLTFSGTGYAATSHPLVQVLGYPTSSTRATVTRVTAGVDGRMVISSLVQPTDGSSVPRALITKQDGIKVTNRNSVSADVQFAEPTIGGMILASQILNYPADASLKTWLKSQLNTYGVFQFDDDYV